MRRLARSLSLAAVPSLEQRRFSGEVPVTREEPNPIPFHQRQHIIVPRNMKQKIHIEIAKTKFSNIQPPFKRKHVVPIERSVLEMYGTSTGLTVKPKESNALAAVNIREKALSESKAKAPRTWLEHKKKNVYFQKRLEKYSADIVQVRDFLERYQTSCYKIDNTNPSGVTQLKLPY